jgi:aspartyl-tRNA(Asn)/glutamyl-tRNA(Gln) amidotransferase subunit B
MSSAKEAVAYMRKIHSIVRYLQISDGNMQEGSFRCDANVSVRRTGEKELGTRTEIKNLNSFRFVERAINHEVERQIDVIESGGRIVQETRLYDADDDSTRPMRSKEEANDYRYFPDPDLLPVVIEEALLVEVKAQMPELPHVRSLRYQDSYGLALEEAQQLTVSQEGAAYFDAVVAIVPESAKLIANWVCGDLAAKLKQDELSIEQSPVNAEAMVQLIQRIADGTISGKTAKDVFQAMWTSQASADDIIQQQGLQQISDVGELEALVAQVVEDNPKQVEQYLSGKDKVFGFFVGKLMQMTKGKANPQQVTDLLKAKLVRD